MSSRAPESAELQGHEYVYDHRCIRIVNGEVCYRGKDDAVHQKPATAAKDVIAAAIMGAQVMDPTITTEDVETRKRAITTTAASGSAALNRHTNRRR